MNDTERANLVVRFERQHRDVGITSQIGEGAPVIVDDVRTNLSADPATIVRFGAENRSDVVLLVTAVPKGLPRPKKGLWVRLPDVFEGVPVLYRLA